ncbi:MAG: hypothetical protein H0W37_10325 [Pseudonocardiales bacterium]|nr:hypothetical protein [Pseudonocardiales bacterium]
MTSLRAPMKKMPLFKSTPRPVTARAKPSRSTGPRELRLQANPESRSTLFTTVPAGFKTAHNSATEWMVYAAMAILLGEPKHFTKPPFSGSPPRWYYQKAIDGGRNQRGGSVADFIVDVNGSLIGIRVQTERFHILAGPDQVANDFFMRTHTRAVAHIIDVYDMDFVGDPTGRAVVAVVAKALKLEQNVDPLRSGRFYPVRT